MKPKVVLTREENDLATIAVNFPDIQWISFPLITFTYERLDPDFADILKRERHWLIFTSQNAVRSFYSQIDPGPSKIACVGPKTKLLAEQFGATVHFTPSKADSLTLANEIPVQNEEPVCYVGGNLSKADTLQALKKRTRRFLKLEVYQTAAARHKKEAWQQLFNANPDVLSFCSPSAVKSMVDQLDDYELDIPVHCQYAAIGSTTALSIKDYIGKNAFTGKKHTFDAMIQEIAERLKNDSKA